MDDPAAFAKARLGEDEAAALNAVEETRHCDRCGMEASGRWEVDRGWPHMVQDENSGYTITYEEQLHGGLLAHIAAHDPARALREVEAGRRVLARHEDCVPWGGGPCEHAGTTGGPPCPDLRDLLARWAEHPEYQQEWKP